MSKFKIFDGTNWVDPCVCNISILDIGGISFQQINPNNCIVSYFDGTNWCPITCPCECPDGYTFNSSTNSCEKTIITSAVPSGGTTYPIVNGSKNIVYGEYGARLYEDISSKLFPLNGFQDLSCGATSSCYIVNENAGVGSTLAIQDTSVAMNNIFNSQLTIGKGRLNIAGLWATGYPVDQWLSVTFCITIPIEKTYIFALAGDNQIQASINSSSFNGGGVTNLVNLYASNNPDGSSASSTYTHTFKYWHMFPITLPAGNHTFELSGMNFGGASAFGAEIYDISVTALTSLMNSTSAVMSDLEPYILFSTKNLITTPSLLIAGPGETISWSCPDGTSLETCYGIPSCISIDTIPCDTETIPIGKAEINIWFDNSGTMETTLQPLEIMKNTYLKEALLPLLNYSEDKYNEQVQILPMNTDKWTYDQRFINCLSANSNINRRSTEVELVINLVFTDKSIDYGYSNNSLFNNQNISDLYREDIKKAIDNISNYKYKVAGTIFRINTGPSSYLGFRELVYSTFINNGVYKSPENLSDFYSKNFNCNLDTLPAAKPKYYFDHILASLKALGINIPILNN